MKRKIERMILFSVALVIALGFFFTPMQSRADGGVSLYDTSSKKSSVTVSKGQDVSVQFKVKAGFTKAGIFLGFNDTDKEVTISLYKWDSNTRKTKKSEPVATKHYTSWTRNQAVYVENGSSFPAGEYLLTLSIDKGTNLKIFWHNGDLKYTNGFVGDYEQAGAPESEIFFAGGEGTDAFERVSKPGEVQVEVPEEYVIPEAHPINQLNIDSTLWSFVDGLGRSSVDYKDAGAKKERKVGIFYWTWHYNFAGNKPVNVQKIVEEYPEAANDYNHQIWKKNNVGAYFWNEPIWGYYAVDRYVLRKQAELLADAGVDFVLFDCTNGDFTWDKCYMELLDVWSEAREDGVKTPQIGFMLPFWDYENNKSSLKQIYNKIYQPGLYQDLWFYLDGKPFVMGIKDCLDKSVAIEKEISEFFTFRRGEPSYFEDDHDDTWFGWLHRYPQALYKRADGSVESTTVGVAMNADYTTMSLSAMNGAHNMGRGYSNQKNYSYTYTYRGEEIVASSKMDKAYYYGINFQEQWDYALSVDPDIVFVTGWNEWIAGRNEEWGGVKNGFPDQYNDENSRDIEPSKGDLKDYFYYQLVNNVRKYKGMTAPAVQNVSKTVENGDFNAWNDENLISYNHYAHNTLARENTKGWSGVKFNSPGIRNDFITAKAVNDEENVYFYIETENDITSYKDENWMRLLLDTGAATKDSKDWEDFEYIIGRETGTDKTLVLERSKGGWDWEKVADVSYSVSGNKMMVTVKKSDIGISGNDFVLGFKWADANLADGDVLTLYTDGDAAPGGRFTFVMYGSDNVIETPAPEDGGNATPGRDEKKGCGSVIGVFAALPAMAAVLIIFKKKSA